MNPGGRRSRDRLALTGEPHRLCAHRVAGTVEHPATQDHARPAGGGKPLDVAFGSQAGRHRSVLVDPVLTGVGVDEADQVADESLDPASSMASTS